MITTILANPILRKSIAYIIIFCIGFSFAYVKQSRHINKLKTEKSNLKGKYEEVLVSKDNYRKTMNNLQNVISDIAMQERVKIDNHLHDTKVKDGAQLVFTPKNKATLSVSKDTENDKEIATEKKVPTKKNLPTKHKKSWLRRFFTRRKKKI